VSSTRLHAVILEVQRQLLNAKTWYQNWIWLQVMCRKRTNSRQVAVSLICEDGELYSTKFRTVCVSSSCHVCFYTDTHIPPSSLQCYFELPYLFLHRHNVPPSSLQCYFQLPYLFLHLHTFQHS
jgi:hypothetical protein